MKSLAIIVLTLAIAFAAKTEVKLGAQLSARGKDAVESALNILYDLRKANLESSRSAEGRNKTDEDQGLRNVQALTQLTNLNKNTLDHAVAYRTQVQSDHSETKNYIAWLNGRVVEVRRKIRALHRERCYSNALFVKAIKENQDALQVIELLGEDLKGYLSSASQLNFAQVADVTDKLKMYAHLFKEQAVKEFSQLASDSTVENKENTEVNTQKIQALLAALRTNLASALRALEVNEIKAAYDLARYITDSEGEIRWLNDEASRKRTYLDRLSMLLTGARNSESKSHSAWEEATKTLNTSIEELRNKRYFYARERARRVEENSLIEELIRLFKDRVGAMGESNV